MSKSSNLPNFSFHIFFIFIVALFYCASLPGCLGNPSSDNIVPSLTQRVSRVIDGDTIELEDGSRVRYLGIDAPEVRRRQGEKWIYDPKPGAKEATRRNRELVEGRRVTLKTDEKTHDRYDRLLAHVFLLDGEVHVNRLLVREGHARVLVIPPNQAYSEELKEAERQAQAMQRGIWR